MPKFEKGNQAARLRQYPKAGARQRGRPQRITFSVLDACTQAELKKLVRKAYELAMKGETQPMSWLLQQIPKPDSLAKLPPGLPPLTGIEGYMQALDAIGEQARSGQLSVAAAERAANLVLALAAARSGVLQRFGRKLDQDEREMVERERQQAADAGKVPPPPVWPPVH